MAQRYQRDTALLRNLGGESLCDELHALGVTIPPPVAAARKHVDELAQRAGCVENIDAVRQHSLALLAEDATATIDDLIAQEIAAGTLHNTLLEAGDRARRALTHAITAYSDELTREVERVVFAPAIATLTTVAGCAPTETPSTLLLDGRNDEAHSLASAPDAYERVILALKIRGRVHKGSDIDQMPHRIWKNPLHYTPQGVSGLDYWLDGLRNGLEPWLAT